MGKNQKRYYRKGVKILILETNGKPVVVTGRYKHSNIKKWATFTCIRPYIPGIKTKTICSHINIERYRLFPWYILDKEYHNRKFYIICNPIIYWHYGHERGTLQPAENIGIKPIILFGEAKYLIDGIINECHRFDRMQYEKKKANRIIY